MSDDINMAPDPEVPSLKSLKRKELFFVLMGIAGLLTVAYSVYVDLIDAHYINCNAHPYLDACNTWPFTGPRIHRGISWYISVPLIVLGVIGRSWEHINQDFYYKEVISGRIVAEDDKLVLFGGREYKFKLQGTTRAGTQSRSWRTVNEKTYNRYNKGDQITLD